MMALLAVVACSDSGTETGGNSGGGQTSPKQPQITLNASAVDFPTEGGSREVTFNSSEAWTAQVVNNRADDWCFIEPVSGAAGNASIVITTTENDTPDDRTASVIIKAGTASKTVKVSQKQKDALTVTSSKFEVAAEGGEVVVEVKANIDFEYVVDDAAKEWISYEGTRAIQTSTLVFKIKANDDTEKREGKITIKSGELKETVNIYQAGSAPSIVISQNEYVVPSAGETIAVEVKSNVDVLIEIPQDANWIKENATRGVSTNTYYFDIDENVDYDQRSAEIKFTNKENNLSEVVKVVQVQCDAIVLAQSVYEVPSEGGEFELEVLHNIDFETSVDVGWISLQSTRAMEKKTLVFFIEGNGGNERREGDVTFTSKDGAVKQTVTFSQGKNSGTVTSGEDNATFYIDSEGGVVECPILTDWDLSELDVKIYGLNIGDEKPDWINLATENTRALEEYKLRFNITPNASNETPNRYATVYVSAKNSGGCIFRISQYSPFETNARKVLARFYEEMDGDNWPNNENWCTDVALMNWYGQPRYDENGNIYIERDLQGISGVLTTEAVDGIYWINLEGNNITAVDIDGVESLRALYLDGTTAKDISVKDCVNLEWFNFSASTENLELSNCGITEMWMDVRDDPNLYYDDRMLSTIDINNCNSLTSIALYAPHMTKASVTNCATLESVDLRPSMSHYDDKPNGLLSAITIEECPKLESLTLSKNSLTNFDLSKILSLKSFNGSYNKFTTIDVSKNTNLETLNLAANPSITSIDVSRNLALKSLQLFGLPNIATLDVSGLTQLEELWIGANAGSVFEYPNSNVKSSIMTTLKANGCSSLKEIHSLDYRVIQNSFYEAQMPQTLSTLELAGCNSLEVLDVSYTSLKVVDLSDCYNLKRLYASGGMDVIYIPMYGENNFNRSNLQISNANGESYIDFPIVPKEHYLHTSTDFSKDGQVRVIQRATVGNGIDIVIMGEAFNDTMVNDGTYDEQMNKVVDALFAYEPFKSFRDMFNVYAVTAVSEKAYINSGKSVLQMETPDWAYVAQTATIKSYAEKAVSSDSLENTAVVVAVNGYGRSNCVYENPVAENDYGCGFSMALCDTWDVNYNSLIQHEVVGHGFAKLADEYIETPGEAPSNAFVNEKYGWLKNIDDTNNLNNIKWAKFIQDSRYASEQLGAYEGGTYETGVWRATQQSIMNDHTVYSYFNAPSREAIYYRIHKLAYGADWEYDYEEFVEWDAKNRSTSSSTRGIPYRPTATADFKPTHPPVVINKTWREAMNQ